MNQRLTKITGYRYKLSDLDRPGFTTVFVRTIRYKIKLKKIKAGKLRSVLKLCLTGLEQFSKELILTMKPVVSNSTINPVHQFIQCYNENQFLLMLFASKNLDDKNINISMELKKGLKLYIYSSSSVSMKSSFRTTITNGPNLKNILLQKIIKFTFKKNITKNI